MASHLIGFDLFTLKGDPVSRAVAVLRIARQQVRLAYGDTESWRLEAVLSAIEDEIGGCLGRIANAMDSDAADQQASGKATAQRQAELPLRAA
ncbi:MAG: hypothetical protein QOD93_2947 [Acetobacteraceae bacterium]|nr:hypothetical protein [Acetobacteraceae bacterium]